MSPTLAALNLAIDGLPADVDEPCRVHLRELIATWGAEQCDQAIAFGKRIGRAELSAAYEREGHITL